ncbi:MAG: hypothetical protein M3067_12880 [Chloroflexota bacterium]|nr:hypothetical protein [Chloroflexota bacterium]
MLQPTTPLGRPNRPIAVLGVVAWLAGLGLVAGLALAGRDESARPSVPPTAAAAAPTAGLLPAPAPTPATGAIRYAAGYATPIAVVPGPMAVTVGAGSVWVVTLSDLRVWRIDPATNEVSGKVDLPFVAPPSSAPQATASGEAASSTVGVARSPAGQDLFPVVAVGAGSLWVLGAPAVDTLVQIDPARLRVIRTLRLPAAATGLVTGPAVMWVTTDAGLLLGIDPVAGRVRQIVRLGAGRVWAAAGRDSTWVSAPDGRILRLDAAGVTTATVTGGGGPIAVKDGSVWIRTDRTLIRLDERTGRSLQRTDIGTSGDTAIAWALPSIVSLSYDDTDALVAPRESWIAETPTSLWIARPDKGEVWLLQPPVR